MLLRVVKLEAKFLSASNIGGERSLGTDREIVFSTTFKTHMLIF